MNNMPKTDASAPAAIGRHFNIILGQWFAKGVLASETRDDEESKPREFVVPGQWKDEEYGGE
jgi:hypothetical protein